MENGYLTKLSRNTRRMEQKQKHCKSKKKDKCRNDKRDYNRHNKSWKKF